MYETCSGSSKESAASQLETVNGVGAGLVVELLPPPSQLISRHPLVRGPAALPLLGDPMALRKASTTGLIEFASIPAAELPNELLREDLARTSKKKITGNHEPQEIDGHFACRASHKMLLSG